MYVQASGLKSAAAVLRFSNSRPALTGGFFIEMGVTAMYPLDNGALLDQIREHLHAIDVLPDGLNARESFGSVLNSRE